MVEWYEKELPDHVMKRLNYMLFYTTLNSEQKEDAIQNYRILRFKAGKKGRIKGIVESPTSLRNHIANMVISARQTVLSRATSLEDIEFGIEGSNYNWEDAFSDGSDERWIKFLDELLSIPDQENAKDYIIERLNAEVGRSGIYPASVKEEFYDIWSAPVMVTVVTEVDIEDLLQ